MVDQNITDPHMIKEKIVSVLKVLRFREQRVLVQFWSPVAVKKRWLLMTWDQPFGLGVADEGLYQYRLTSELHAVVVDEEQREELDPVGRVYSKKMPEWSLDVQGGDTSYNIHGYIVLPVFESSSGCCVGVLEIITSSSYVDYDFEVEEVSRALKKQNLKSPSMFEDPSVCVADERRQHELDKIFNALKMVCDVQNLPLAQTWALAESSSSVASSGILKHSCSSFNRSCIGKACMLTTDLPCYVRDLSMWGFRESCKEKHLEISKGVVGRSLAFHGSWFCWNVTELDEDEYPLAPFARMSGLTSCLAIYLKSRESDVEYVIEFFLPPCDTNKTELQRLTKAKAKAVRQQIKNISWEQADIMSTPHVIEVPLHLESQPSPITLLTEKEEIPQLESENLKPFVENEQNDVDVMFSKKHNEVVHVEQDNMVNEPSNSTVGGTSRSVVPYLEKEAEDNPGRAKRKDSDISKGTRKKRKRSESSITFEEVKIHFGKTMDEAASILNVSRSTLKRICRNLGIPRWPYMKNPADKSDFLLRSDHTDVIVHGKEGALSPVIEGSNEPLRIANVTHDLVTPTKDGKHSSTLVHQQEHTNQSDARLEPDTDIRGKFIESISANAVKFSTIKAIYREITVKFLFNLSDGLVKLEELVAARFQLGLGSFWLKYVDEDGDKISILCDSDLTVMSAAFGHPDKAVVIKLLVTDQNSDA